MLEYPGGYTRSVGPVIGRFLTGLRDGRIEAVKLADGRVLVPPTEYDPTTSEPVAPEGSHWMEVGPRRHRADLHVGVRAAPGKHTLTKPFTFALIRPDGADTAILHMVDVSGPDAFRVGLRVAPRWRAERTGHVTTSRRGCRSATARSRSRRRCTSPPRTSSRSRASPRRSGSSTSSPPASSTARYLEGLGEGKIIGGKAPSSDDVYAASRGTDPITGELTSIEVEVQDRGVITTFCVVNIPGLSELAPEIPYVSAQILLDGANNTFFGLIRGVEVDDVHMGMRVKVKWADELKPDHTSIMWWEPTGEPDEDYDRYKDYL